MLAVSFEAHLWLFDTEVAAAIDGFAKRITVLFGKFWTWLVLHRLQFGLLFPPRDSLLVHRKPVLLLSRSLPAVGGRVWIKDPEAILEHELLFLICGRTRRGKLQ